MFLNIFRVSWILFFVLNLDYMYDKFSEKSYYFKSPNFENNAIAYVFLLYIKVKESYFL